MIWQIHQHSRINPLFSGVKVYRKFYMEEREKSYGVLAISVSKPSVQPYTTMTDILAVSVTLQNFVQNFFHISRCHLLHYHYGCTFFFNERRKRTNIPYKYNKELKNASNKKKKIKKRNKKMKNKNLRIIVDILSYDKLKIEQ